MGKRTVCLLVAFRPQKNLLVYLNFSCLSPQPRAGEELGQRGRTHEVHLARLSQANAVAGLGTSVGGHLWLPAQLFGRGPAKARSVGWRQVASWAANTFWHGLKEHLVPLCGPTTEGQRMCLLAAT